jgi:hypothetical protein
VSEKTAQGADPTTNGHGNVWDAVTRLEDPVERGEVLDAIAKLGGVVLLEDHEVAESWAQIESWGSSKVPKGFVKKKWQDAVDSGDTEQAVFWTLPPKQQDEVISKRVEEKQAEVEAAGFDNLAQLNEYELGVIKERIRRRVRKKVDAEERDEVEVPEPLALADLIEKAETEIAWRLTNLMPAGSRVVLAAARKTGKTTMVGNGVRSLADGGLFLNGGLVVPTIGTVAVIDNEMNSSMLGRWYRDLGIKNQDRVVVWPLRGQGAAFDPLDEDLRAKWVARLKALPDGCSVLVLDCLAPALGALGLTESNEDVNVFLIGIDRLLQEAGVGEFLLAHHMGHGPERSRGASRLRDWPEVEWQMVREVETGARGEEAEVDNGARFFKAYGRDVDVPESKLAYDPRTRSLSLAGGTRSAHKADKHVPAVEAIVRKKPGIRAGDLQAALKHEAGIRHNASLVKAVQAAIRAGVIATQQEGTSTRHYPVGEGAAT